MWAEHSFVLSQSMRLTDGRTDGRTDGFLLAYRALHYMESHGKKWASTGYLGLYFPSETCNHQHRSYRTVK